MGKRFGLLFPGQGAQHVGMGKELYDTRLSARLVFDRAGEILGRDIGKLCFEGPEDELMATANSQPAIFVTSIAALNVLIQALKGGYSGGEKGEMFSPQDILQVGGIVMGLSLGEPVALMACGALSFEDGLHFVRKRGEFMEEASQKKNGKMASIIGLDLKKVEEICTGVGCQVANLNCPGQVVISGAADLVELAIGLAGNAGARRTIMLKVNGAFHSELMLPAKEKLKAVLDDMEIGEPVVDFISNIDAEVTRAPRKIRANLSDQLDNRTLWEACVRNAVSKGFREYLEIGPGSVLKGLLRKIDSSLSVTTLHTSEDIDNLVGRKGSDLAL